MGRIRASAPATARTYRWRGEPRRRGCNRNCGALWRIETSVTPCRCALYGPNGLVAIVNKIAERFIEAANAHTERVVAETIVRERERVARIVERVEPITGF